MKYPVDKELTLRELQLQTLNLMEDIHRFCVDNGIRYSIFSGTLLGAVRHKGFIPWDDDADIVMTRPDFDRFCKTFSSKSNRIIYYGNDRSAIACFARVVDVTKTKYWAERPWTRQDTGIWVDIFSIDGIGYSISHFESRYYAMQRLKSIVYKFRRENHFIIPEDTRWDIFKTYLAKILSINGVVPSVVTRLMVRNISKYVYDESEKVSEYTSFVGTPKVYDKTDFEEYILYDFEGKQFYGIANYDKVLSTLYGNYMQLPPEKDRVAKQYWIHFTWR